MTTTAAATATGTVAGATHERDGLLEELFGGGDD